MLDFPNDIRNGIKSSSIKKTMIKWWLIDFIGLRLYIRLTRRLCYKKQKLLKRRKHLGFRFVVGFELLIVYVICVVVCFYVLFVFVMWFMCPMLPVFLDCLLLIAPSVFSIDYLNFLQNIRRLEFLKNFACVEITL